VCFCTAFDSGYLARGLAMISSLRDAGVRDEVVVLCLDDDCLAYMQELALEGIALLGLQRLEAVTPGLTAARSGRSKGEYIFTCIPSLINHVLENAAPSDYVTYLDSDVFFYADPTEELCSDLHRLGGSIGLTSHRFPEDLKHLRQYGDFNAGCVVFRNDDRGRTAARWWSDACLNWCLDHPDSGRYANQGYLNDIARQFEGAFVLPAGGLNVAPWNMAGTTIHQMGQSYCLEDGTPLVFFHFHGLRQRGSWMYTGLRAFKVSADSAVLQGLYAPYVLRLEEIAGGIASINCGYPITRTDALVGTRRSRGVRTLLRRARGRYLQAVERVRGEAIPVPVILVSGSHQNGESL
jgi:hypothetical protein